MWLVRAAGAPARGLGRGAGGRNARPALCDVAEAVVRGGRGGRGAGGFSYGRPGAVYGRPAGGSGGRGGDVVLVPSAACVSLAHIHGRGGLAAGAGGAGGPSGRAGARGRDLEVPVPLGVVLADATGPAEIDGNATHLPDADAEANRRVASVPVPAAAHVPLPCGDVWTRLVVAAGGRGGRGNAALGRDNAQVESGQPGGVRRVRLEMRMLADAGLVGAPNAGKSSLLGAVSAARPAVADYAFTTLRPQVGVALADTPRRLVLADIPGLVAGAAAGRGLGTSFLRHVVRARTLVLVVDASAGDAGATAAGVLGELEAHTPGLARRVSAVAANKADVFGDDCGGLQAAVERISAALGSFWRARFAEPLTAPVLPVSAKHGLALERLLAVVGDAVYSVALE